MGKGADMMRYWLVFNGLCANRVERAPDAVRVERAPDDPSPRPGRSRRRRVRLIVASWEQVRRRLCAGTPPGVPPVGENPRRPSNGVAAIERRRRGFGSDAGRRDAAATSRRPHSTRSRTQVAAAWPWPNMKSIFGAAPDSFAGRQVAYWVFFHGIARVPRGASGAAAPSRQCRRGGAVATLRRGRDVVAQVRASAGLAPGKTLGLLATVSYLCEFSYFAVEYASAGSAYADFVGLGVMPFLAAGCYYAFVAETKKATRKPAAKKPTVAAAFRKLASTPTKATAPPNSTVRRSSRSPAPRKLLNPAVGRGGAGAWAG